MKTDAPIRLGIENRYNVDPQCVKNIGIEHYQVDEALYLFLQKLFKNLVPNYLSRIEGDT